MPNKAKKTRSTKFLVDRATFPFFFQQIFVCFLLFKNPMLTPSQRFLSVRAATQAEGAGGKPNLKIPKNSNLANKLYSSKTI